MAACLFWTGSADLPLFFVECISQTYVHPSVCFGLEFVPAGPQTARFQTRELEGREQGTMGKQVAEGWGFPMGWSPGLPSLPEQAPKPPAIQVSKGWTRMPKTL